jgi:hypothetical protein
MVITSSLRPSFRQIINHYNIFNIHHSEYHRRQQLAQRRDVEAKREQTKQNKREVPAGGRGPAAARARAAASGGLGSARPRSA